MTHQLIVSDPELSLILELLEREQRQQLFAIRHTDAPDFRNVLRERLALLDSLIQRAQTAAVSS